jgi:hypothetical protein
MPTMSAEQQVKFDRDVAALNSRRRAAERRAAEVQAEAARQKSLGEKIYGRGAPQDSGRAKREAWIAAGVAKPFEGQTTVKGRRR